MGYFKVFKDTLDDQRMFDLAEQIEAQWEGLSNLTASERRQIVGLLGLGLVVKLWGYADTYIDSDNRLHVSLGGLAAALNVPIEVLQKFPHDWLEVTANGEVILPGYCRRNNMRGKDERKVAYQKRKVKDRLRKERERTRRRHTADTLRTDNGQGAEGARPSVPIPSPDRDRNTETRDREGASQAAPSRRAAAPRKKSEVPWQPPAKDSTWESHSPPSGPPRGASFEDDFRKRFGVTPGEAHEMREAKEAPKDDPPKF